MLIITHTKLIKLLGLLLWCISLSSLTKAVDLNNSTIIDGELCQRTCIEGDQRICHFHFVLEHYQAMGVACGNCENGVPEDCWAPQCIVGDGYEKGVMSINRQVPGPAIHVCRGDLVVIDVANHAHGTAAAIHWHGMHMVDTPHMDGVPYVTQCPIPFANSFRYQFLATEAGTHFYHSHAGHHKINGQYGALIVRAPEEQKQHLAVIENAQYDHDLPEHHILISDWMHAYGEQMFPGLPGSGGIYPDSLLVNGRGAHIGPDKKRRFFVPPTRYFVERGKRYRFRLINSVSHACPVQLQIENHKLIVTASDGYDIEPRDFDAIISNSGERYDFILEANQTAGDYFVRVRGMGICGIHPTEALAVISYQSNGVVINLGTQGLISKPPEYDDEYPIGRVLNHPNVSCFAGEQRHCVSELVALEADDDLRTAQADYKFYLSFNNYPVPNEEIFKEGHYNHFSNLQENLTVVGAINKLSMVFPDFPPLTQPELIDESHFCDEFHWPKSCKDKKLCSCVHRLRIHLDSIVELIIVDESENVGRMHHPFHLHGHRFTVNALGQHPQGVPMTVSRLRVMERQRMLPIAGSQNPRPPFKDTISIPSRGYAVVRFRAENPGFWLMHCHYEWHLAIGMGLVLQVGDVSEMVTPPADFPRCGNYMPKIEWPDRVDEAKTEAY